LYRQTAVDTKTTER